MRSKTNSRKGMAILPVLFILIIISLLASLLVRNQAMDIRIAYQMQEQTQARHYALGAETMAKEMLLQDYKESKIDHNRESWHGNHEFKTDSAKTSFTIEDLQGKFNINSLIKEKANKSDKEAEQEVNENALVIFNKILARGNISEKTADTFLDWLDEDNKTRPNGAEDREYVAFGNPPFYKAGNGLMADISETKLIRGVDEISYNKLLNYVTVLPEHKSRININAASDIIVESAILDSTLSEKIIAAKHQKSFLDKDELERLSPGNKIFSVSSQYFVVYIKAHCGNSDIYLTSLLYREEKKQGQDGAGKAEMHVLGRKFGKRFDL